MAQLQRLIIAPTQQQDCQIFLTEEQQHYLLRVLRLRDGDRFIAVTANGKWLLSQLTGKSAQVIEMLSVQTELPVEITLMVALPKNGFDEVVRQTTELGVSCIVPVLSDRTLLHPSSQKLERWRRIAQEAAEQSERQLVPTILEPVPLTTALSSFIGDYAYICVARGESSHLLRSLQDSIVKTQNSVRAGLSEILADSEILPENPPLQTQTSIAIATGPEGGWTAAEVAEAIALGFHPVSLGRRILRAVTAPFVALSLVAAAWE